MASLLDNPELTAMAGIVEILKELPDEASRLRVMRWAFGRFSEEFKRPTAPVVPPAAVPAPARTAEALEIKTVLAVAPELAIDRPSTSADFARQISELHELFPQQAEPAEAAVPKARTVAPDTARASAVGPGEAHIAAWVESVAI